MSRQNFFRVAESRLGTVQDSQIDRRSIRTPGSNVNVIYGGISAVGEEVDRRSSARFAGRVVDAAEGEELSSLVAELSFGRVVRKGASAATVTLGVSRPGTSGAITLATGLVADIGGVAFTLDAPGVTFANGEGGPLVVKPASFTAQQAGTATNVVVTAPRFTGSAAVTFGALLAPVADEPRATGGAEREADPALKARFKIFTRGLDQNISLIEAGALATPGIESAVALEELSPEGFLTGNVILHVADANGRAGAPLRALVTATLRGYRMAGQIITVLSALPELTSITLRFGVLAGFSVGDVQARARSAVVASVNALEPGQSLFRAIVSAALAGVPGLVFLEAEPSGVVIPAADLIATPSTRFRTSAELVGFAA